MEEQPQFPPAPAAPAAPGMQRSWFGRNWKWFVPLLLSPCVICGGFIAIMVTVVFGALKGSDAYKQSLAAVQNDPAVVAALGTPIEAGMAVSGNISVNNASGHAELSYDVSGPKGSATVSVIADKSGGAWTTTSLDVTIHATGETIDLLGGTAPHEDAHKIE